MEVTAQENHSVTSMGIAAGHCIRETQCDLRMQPVAMLQSV